MTAPRFFSSAAQFRSWLEAHHESESALVVGFHLVDSGVDCMTWTEAVREALCFGWIDGVVKRIDDRSYSRRFTPRTARSIWSAVNIRHAEQLIAEGHMHAAGLAAFNARSAARSGVYSFEQSNVELPAFAMSDLCQNEKAQRFWDTLPASYRRAAAWWVASAKQAATRERRAAALIDHCDRGLRLPQFVSNASPRPRKGPA